MTGAAHRLRAARAPMPGGFRVPLERDTARGAHEVQLVGLLGVEAHAAKLPAVALAGGPAVTEDAVLALLAVLGGGVRCARTRTAVSVRPAVGEAAQWGNGHE